QLLRETRLDNAFFVSQIVAIADPFTLPKLHQTLPSIRAQIEAADTILINKTDLATPEALMQTETLIQEINPNAPCRLTTFCRIEMDIFGGQPSLRDMAGKLAECSDPRYFNLHISHPMASVERLKITVSTISDAIYRLKGFIQTEDDLVSVDFSGSGWQIEKAQAHIQYPELAVICRPEDRDRIMARFRETGIFGHPK
ncbi:MAG: GTP-binding protein, partial [archaeon]